MKLQRAGMHDGAVVNLTRALMDQSAAKADDLRDGWPGTTKFPGMVSSGREKIEAEKTSAAPAQIFDPWDDYVVPPFPLDILPDDVQWFVETQSRVIGCDPSAIAMTALASFSVALDHRVGSRCCAMGTGTRIRGCGSCLWEIHRARKRRQSGRRQLHRGA